jgi:hypothetical protein
MIANYSPSFILHRAIFGNAENKINPRFIKSTGIEFPKDDGKIKVPIEFRQSIFNTSFLTHCDKEEDEDDGEDNNEYNEFKCGYGNDYLPEFSKEANDYSNLFGCPHSSQHSLKVGDYIGGLEDCGNGRMAYSFCSSCAKEYLNSFSELKAEICHLLIPEIANIILDYTSPPLFTLIKSSDKLVCTSQFSDWLQFLHVSLAEDSKTWFINCNLDSKFYGCVMMVDEQNDLFIMMKGIDSIKEFEAIFLEKYIQK